jgi:hypothetical protein
MTGRDFLAAARRLAASTEEADWRSAASRAYYAAFHGARDYLAALRFRTPRADRAHNYRYVRFNNAGHPTVERAANLLHDLRTRRNFADYDLQAPFRPGMRIPPSSTPRKSSASSTPSHRPSGCRSPTP